MFRSMLALLLLLLPCTPVFSDDSSVVVPPDTKLVLQVDIATFGKTVLGKRFLKLTEEMASEEIGEDGADVMANVKTALGFDPLTETQSLLVMSSSYEEPESNIHSAIAKLGKTTGNLEGLILSLPLMLSLKEYKTVKQGEHTIHCASDEDFEGFVAIHTDKQKSKWVLGSSNIDNMRVMLDGLNSQADKTDATHRVPAELTDGEYAKIHLLDVSGDVLDLGDDIAEITQKLTNVYVSLKEEGDAIVVSVHATAFNEIQAELVRGLAEGLIRLAFAEAAIEAGPTDDVGTKLFLELFKNTTVSCEGNEVYLRASAPIDLMLESLIEGADLPL